MKRRCAWLFALQSAPCFALSEDTSCPSSSSDSRQTRSASLLQLSSLKAQPGMSAQWFKSFTEGEATYDEDQAMHPEDSPSLLVGSPPLGVFDREGGVLPAAKESKWFQESRSGGSAEAWQTYYPALDTVKTAGFAESQAMVLKAPAKWTESGEQLYVAGVEAKASAQLVYGKTKPDTLSAGWFEPSVVDVDVFGRKRAPSEGSPKSYMEWEARSSTAKLACPEAGCVANTSLQLFDPQTEEAQLCSLSISLHATDFDDAFSSEHLDWVYVNDESVTVNCDPMESGCADANLPASERKLYPCVTDRALGEGSISTGSVNVSGKLNKMVDECPVDGNLLSGVANVTCFIRKKSEVKVTVPVVTKTETVTPGLNGTALLQCAEPGCEAVAVIQLSQAVSNKTCLLTLRVNDTDFDNTLTEKIVVISVGSNSLDDNGVYRELGHNVTSGKNPCHEAFLQANSSNGTAPSFVQSSFMAVENENVSSSVFNGSLTISAKLSDMVDECGRNGFLLDAMATVTCS